MFFNILGNLEPRPLACAAQGCPVSCPGRGQPWKYLRQRTRPRVTARRCPMRRTPSRRRQFEGRPLAGALSRGRVDGCIRLRRPTSRGADELVGHRRTTAARSTMSKTKAHGRLPEGVVLDPPSPVRVQCSVY